MKKTITLIAVAALISSASFAQYNNPRNNGDRNRDVVVYDNNGKGGDRGTYYFTARERDMEIAAINREYYRKIEAVKSKLFMGRSKKERVIYSLEAERNAEVRNVIAKFNDRRNKFDRRDKRYGDHDRRNNW